MAYLFVRLIGYRTEIHCSIVVASQEQLLVALLTILCSVVSVSIVASGVTIKYHN